MPERARNRRILRLALGLAALKLAACPLTATAGTCAELRSLDLGHTEITAAELVPAGGFEQPGGGRFGGFGGRAFAALPEFCRVEAVSRPGAGSEIGIEVWLPTSGWNTKLEGVGNGAWAGSIGYTALADGLAAGFAVAGTDTGHKGGRPDFLGDPDRRIDFAHRAVHEMTLTAKAVTEAFYERSEERAYFTGCSTGGRQALTEAQRYPDDYDGIVAGAPAYYPSHIQGMQVWTAAIANRSAESRLDADAQRLLNAAVIGACDARDGVTDGVIENPRDCRFDPGELACPAGGGSACLNPSQVETARLIYGGPTGSRGESIYPGLERGSEAGWTTLAGDAPLSLALETFALLVYDDPDWNWRDFDSARDIATAVDRIGPLMDSNDADIDAFVAHGGKLILYHGWADPGIPPGGTIEYYENVRSALGRRQSDDSVRLFLVPGMGHCAGGTGTDRFDTVAALDAWLESGRPPARIEAERRANGDLVRSRPLCPYPTSAVYGGSGSTDEAVNFSCR